MHKARGQAPSPDAARLQRQAAVTEVRRALVLDAARSAFSDLGLEGASLREIAKRAGYSPGALYSYFASKEEVYAALLGESLERLNAQVTLAAIATTDPATRLRHVATAFFDFYRENPRDLDLGFYLFHGMQPRGLTPALNEPLNHRLRDALQPAQVALLALGLPAEEAQAEVTALFAHSVGLLVLSHTGRIRMFKQSSQQLHARYLSALLLRVQAVPPPPPPPARRPVSRPPPRTPR